MTKDEQITTLLAAVETLERRAVKAEGLARIQTQAVNNRPLCPDCRDKTSENDPCLRCQIQRLTRQKDRAEARVTALEAEHGNSERVNELARWEAYRLHRKASDADGYGSSAGHAGQFGECAHEDCKLIRAAALTAALKAAKEPR